VLTSSLNSCCQARPSACNPPSPFRMQYNAPSACNTHRSLLQTGALQVLLPHNDDVKIEGASVGEKWMVIAQRGHAQQTLVTYALPPGGSMPEELSDGHKVEFDEPAYTLSGGGLPQCGQDGILSAAAGSAMLSDCMLSGSDLVSSGASIWWCDLRSSCRDHTGHQPLCDVQHYCVHTAPGRTNLEHNSAERSK